MDISLFKSSLGNSSVGLGVSTITASQKSPAFYIRQLIFLINSHFSYKISPSYLPSQKLVSGSFNNSLLGETRGRFKTPVRPWSPGLLFRRISTYHYFLSMTANLVTASPSLESFNALTPLEYSPDSLTETPPFRNWPHRVHAEMSHIHAECAAAGLNSQTTNHPRRQCSMSVASEYARENSVNTKECYVNGDPWNCATWQDCWLLFSF